MHWFCARVWRGKTMVEGRTEGLSLQRGHRMDDENGPLTPTLSPSEEETGLWQKLWGLASHFRGRSINFQFRMVFS
jgi:hypothetical protein